ncbi:MAG: cupin domain-containing protein [Bacteroidales bacterium]|nr:cupin domain-containing protein [Bacteroidales bacterium]
MDNDVLFYVLKGEGTITVDNETSGLGTGDCIVVPHQAESRSIHAVTDLEILAVQGISNK